MKLQTTLCATFVLSAAALSGCATTQIQPTMNQIEQAYDRVSQDDVLQLRELQITTAWNSDDRKAFGYLMYQDMKTAMGDSNTVVTRIKNQYPKIAEQYIVIIEDTGLQIYSESGDSLMPDIADPEDMSPREIKKAERLKEQKERAEAEATRVWSQQANEQVTIQRVRLDLESNSTYQQVMGDLLADKIVRKHMPALAPMMDSLMDDTSGCILMTSTEVLCPVEDNETATNTGYGRGIAVKPNSVSFNSGM